MNTFVKVKNYPEWFILLSNTDTINNDFTETRKTIIKRSEVFTLHNQDKDLDFRSNIILNSLDHLDYNKIVQEIGTILIRENGTYMPLRGNEIIEKTLGYYYPINETGEIVICENDKLPEPKLINYLKENYPNKKIKTINFFDLRSDNEIKEIFNKAEVVSFYTTLTNINWFEKMIKNIQPNNKVIGYCIDNTKWDIADKIYGNIEKINL